MDLTKFGPWYASRNSNVDDFLLSIERIRKLSPTAVVTSHGDGLITKDIDGRLEAYADIIHRRDREIVEFVAETRALDEILELEIVYRKKQKEPDSFFYWDDRWMIETHLARLIRMGKLIQDDENYSPA